MKAPPQNNPSALPPQEELIDETVLDGLHRLHRKTRPLAKTVIMLSLQSAPAALEHRQQSAVKGDAACWPAQVTTSARRALPSGGYRCRRGARNWGR
jgi:hypothetical protein